MTTTLVLTTLWDPPCCTVPRCLYWGCPGSAGPGVCCGGARQRWETRQPHTSLLPSAGRGETHWGSRRSPGPKLRCSQRLCREGNRSSCKTVLQSGEGNTEIKTITGWPRWYLWSLSVPADRPRTSDSRPHCSRSRTRPGRRWRSPAWRRCSCPSPASTELSPSDHQAGRLYVLYLTCRGRKASFVI